MKYLGESLDKATSAVVEDLKINGGMGGLIAIDQAGQGTTLLLRLWSL